MSYNNNKPPFCSTFGNLCPQEFHTLPFHKKVTNYEHTQPDPVSDQFIHRLYRNKLEHRAKVMF